MGNPSEAARSLRPMTIDFGPNRDMSHFGFLCPPYLGHLNPMAALATELRRRGHRTSFLALADVRKTVEGSGAGLIPLGEATFPAGIFTRLRAHMAAPRGLGVFRIISDVARMTGMLCSEAPAAIERAGIDGLVVDQLEPAGGLIAAHLGLPFISVANALPIDREPALPPPFTDWRYDPSPWGLRRNAGGYQVADLMMMGLDRVIGTWARAWRLPHRRMSDCVSAEAEITQLVPGFDFPRHSPPAALRYCGPLRDAEARSDIGPLLGDGSRPLVFASLGTLQGGRLDLFMRIAQACAALDLHLVIAHGGGLTPNQIRALPGSPVVRHFVPQRALLRHAALAVTNGGLNTVLDALAAGVPLVVVPIAFEQGAIGARLEACGAGIMLPLRKARAARLGDAMRRILREPSLGAAAERLSGEIGRAGGAAAAADLTESMVRIPSRGPIAAISA